MPICDQAPTRGPQLLPSELMIWLSPAFPVGGFAYSQGLETAVAKGWVHNYATLLEWLTAVVGHGALRNDLILLSLVIRARGSAEIAAIADLSAALQPSAERAKEARDLGTSFWSAYSAAWQVPGGNRALDCDRLTLPVAVGLAARDYRFAASPVLEAFATAYASNQVSAAIRLAVIGQFDGQRILAELLAVIRRLAAFAATAGADDLGTATYGADLASLLHETQTSRLFRS